MKLKWILPTVLITGSIMLSGCGEDATETAEKVVKDVEDTIAAEATKDNKYLLAVKGGSFEDYPDTTLEKAFSEFFSSPKWKYFKSEDGQHVVEFTGYCMFREQKVKAKLQFVVDEEGNQFEIEGLAFNDVPQIELIKASLLAAIFEGKQLSESDSAPSGEDVSMELPNLIDDVIGYDWDAFQDTWSDGTAPQEVVFDGVTGYKLNTIPDVIMFTDTENRISAVEIYNPDMDVYGARVGQLPSEVKKIMDDSGCMLIYEEKDEMTGKWSLNYQVDDNKYAWYLSDSASKPVSSITFKAEYE